MLSVGILANSRLADGQGVESIDTSDTEGEQQDSDEEAEEAEQQNSDNGSENEEQEQEHSDGESEEVEDFSPAYEAQRVQTYSYDGLSYEEREEMIRNIEFQDFGWVESVITIV